MLLTYALVAALQGGTWSVPGVLEPALSKTKMLQFATEAAITILRIDDLIQLDPPQEDGEE